MAEKAEEPKLKDVLEHLVNVSAKWKFISIQLGVDVANIHGSDNDCLLEVLTKYLDGSKPSWEEVARVMRSRSVAEDRLAARIEAEYCQTTVTSTVESNYVSSVVAAPLKQDTTDLSIEADRTEPKPKPQSTQGSILATTAKQGAAMQGDARTAAMKPKHPRMVPIRVPSSSSTSSDAFTSPDSLSMERQCSLPYLKTPDLSDEARKNFIGRLLQKTEDMEYLFIEMMFKARKTLEARNMPLKDLLTVLTPIKSATVQSKDTICKTWRAELKTATDILEVFTALEPFVSFFNHEIIEQIIKCFGSKDDRQRLAHYKQKFIEFCILSVCECPNDIYGTKTEKDGIVTVKLDDDFQQYTLKAMNKFRHKLCNILDVSEYDLRLIHVEDGCTEMHFAVYLELLVELFPLSEEQKAKLNEERVILLKWKTDKGNRENIEMEGPTISALEKLSTTTHQQEPTRYRSQEGHFQSLLASVIGTLKKIPGFSLQIIKNTVKDLVSVPPAAKSIEEWFHKMELRASDPESLEILAHIIKILGSKEDRAKLAEYTKHYHIQPAGTSDSYVKQEPQAVTEVSSSSETDTCTSTTPELQATNVPATAGSRSTASHKVLVELVSEIGYPEEAARITYSAEAIPVTTVKGRTYESYKSTAHVPRIGLVSGDICSSISAAKESAAINAYHLLAQHLRVVECHRCHHSWVGSGDERLADRCKRCDCLIPLPHLHSRALTLSTQQNVSFQLDVKNFGVALGYDFQRARRSLNREEAIVEALHHRSRSIREHAELMENVTCMYMPTKAPVAYKYKTEMVSGHAGFKSTVSGAEDTRYTESGVCATKAEAEENAACRLYKEQLLVHLTHQFVYGFQQQRMQHETFMVKRLEEYVQSRGYNAALIRYETVIPFTSNKCQSRVVLPGNGGTHEGEKCYTSITADESAACQAYIILTEDPQKLLPQPKLMTAF